MNPRTVIAVDIGYGNTKVVWSHTLDRQGKSRWGRSAFGRSLPPSWWMKNRPVSPAIPTAC